MVRQGCANAKRCAETRPTIGHLRQIRLGEVQPLLVERLSISLREVTIMAETRKGHKIVHVDGYTRQDGTKVPGHDRSTPDTSTGAKPPLTRKAPPKKGK